MFRYVYNILWWRIYVIVLLKKKTIRQKHKNFRDKPLLLLFIPWAISSPLPAQVPCLPPQPPSITPRHRQTSSQAVSTGDSSRRQQQQVFFSLLHFSSSTGSLKLPCRSCFPVSFSGKLGLKLFLFPWALIPLR